MTNDKIKNSFIISILLYIEKNNKGDSNFNVYLQNQVENILKTVKRLQNENFNTVYVDFRKLLNDFLAFIYSNHEKFLTQLKNFDLNLIEQKYENAQSKLQKLQKFIALKMFKIFNIDIDVNELAKNEKINKVIEKEFKPDDDTIKFLFYFVIADLFISKELKLNISKRKKTFSKLKYSFESYATALNLIGIYKFEKNENQIERNIKIRTRVIEMQYNLVETYNIDDLYKHLNLA